ncbi:uncharacterized protein [Antedon mediterranea]|uniref:uncharacterized protein n=1 Tax=Antedon mediterranea TaxID=105859 RepID=UPI003AF54AD6
MVLNAKKQGIEKKLSKLYTKCKESGLTDEEILAASSPLQEYIKKSKQLETSKKRIRLVVCTAIAICVLAILFQYDPIYRVVCIVGRILSIKTLPFYDWSEFYYMDCVLYNPYYLRDGLTEEDCEMCEDLLYVETFEHLDPKNTTYFLFDNIPIVVTDALDSWKATKEFNLEYIKKLYSEDEVLATSTVCSFVSQSEDDFPTFLQTLGETSPTWNIRWSNCDIQANKILRQYFQRPYFLPDMVQVVGSWVFMASGTKRDPERARLEKVEKEQGDSFFNPEGWQEFIRDDNMQWMAQIKGQYAISLTPVEPCNRTCQPLNFELNPGEILIFTPKMWFFEYMPYGEEDSIALASMGDWE